MKLSIELDDIELQLIAEVIEYVEHGGIALTDTPTYLAWSVIQMLKERASKKLLRMEPGKHKFYLCEMIVLHELLLNMGVEDGLKDTFRIQLVGKLNKEIYGTKALGG